MSFATPLHTSPPEEESPPPIRPAPAEGRAAGSLASGMTLRAIVLGLLFSIGMSWWVVHASKVAHSSFLSITHLPVAALFPFMLVVFVFNGFLKRVVPRRAFSPAEQLIIFFILFTASAIPAWAFTTYWVAIPSIPHYYANTENRWEELFFPYLPDWLVVPDWKNAVFWFYEGLPAGETIPWQAWIIPMGWWGTFFLALAFVSLSLMVILRKQWVERERLTFPLARVPLMLVEEHETPSALPRVAHTRLFWYGFSLPLAVILWNILSYWGTVPAIPFGGEYRIPITLAQSFPPIQFKVNFAFISIGFFTDLNILFSIWFFFLTATIQTGIMSRIGVPKTGEIIVAQHLGGFFMYTLFGLWMARRHLADVARKAFGRGNDVDDTGEFFSYRLAVFGVVSGLLYMVFFLRTAGMSWGIIAVLLTTCMLLYIGVTRVVAEAGLINLDLPFNAHDFTVFSFGSANLQRTDLTVLTLCQTFSRNWRTLGMCSMAHLNKVGEEIGGARKGILSIMILAMLAAAVTSVGYTVYLGYVTTGADHFTGAFGNAKAGYSTLVTWINNQTQLTGGEYTGLLLGALIGWLLILCHHSFHWWPLHPIGWGVAQTWGITMIVTSVFIVWLVKALILRFGGTRLYRQAQPFFIGMIVGYVLGVVLSYGVDVIWFPNAGHVVETW
jgi:hypothetical protein